MTCDFQQSVILISKDSDELVQSPFKLRNSNLLLVSSLTNCSSQIPHCWKLMSRLTLMYVCMCQCLTTNQQMRLHENRLEKGKRIILIRDE